MKTRAAVLYNLNTPLVLDELEIPDLKTGQVLVKMAFSGVCQSQVMEARGKRGLDRFLPHLLGHEGSGVVVKVGAGVQKVKIDDPVVLTWIKSNGADCGGTHYSRGDTIINAGAVTTFSDYTVVSENRCVKLEEGIPMDLASLFGCAVLTGAGLVLNSMHPLPENSILIWGVGGIGLSAVMAANLCQCAKIIAVDTQEHNLKLSQAFGATHLINIQVEEPLNRIREIAGMEGVDFAVGAAGKTSTIESAFSTVRKNGGLCVFASHPPTGEKICLDPYDLISGKQIRGSWGGDPRPDKDIPRFSEFYRQGHLPLEKLISRRYPLEQINQALNDLEQGALGRSLIYF